jgi:histidine decarboxylase
MAGIELDARGCIDRARYLTKTLQSVVPHCNATRFNPFSTTVVFARPTYELEVKYQLATTGDIAHVVVTPSVTKATLDAFVEEYAAQFGEEVSLAK